MHSKPLMRYWVSRGFKSGFASGASVVDMTSTNATAVEFVVG